MFIPGQLIAMVTFPGVILHEVSHRFFCDVTRTEVYDVCYFQGDLPCGYVIHGPVASLKAAFLISIGPLIINTLVCAVLCFPNALVSSFLDITTNLKDARVLSTLAWVGFSCGMHAFPSDDDVEAFMYHVENTHRGALYWAAKPFACLIEIANFAKILWFDFFYALGVSMSIPFLLFRLLP